MSATAIDSGLSEHPTRGVWLTHLVGLGVLIAAIGILFREPIADAVEVWWIYPAFSHCFLILPISLWLVWEKRQVLAAITPSVSLRPLWVFPAVLALWAFGELAAINEARQLAVVGFIQLAIWAMLGSRTYRTVLFPSLYLFFLVPMGEYLIDPLQRLTTQMADLGLTLLGVPHFTQGTVIELTNGRFEIAEACAGLRFLTATVALGVLYAYLTFRRWYKSLLFLLACVIVPIASNGLRVLGIILLAHATNNRLGAGADHIVYGWGFNVAILLALMFLGSLFRDRDAALLAPPASSAASHSSSIPAVAGAALLFLVVFASGPAIAAWQFGRQPNDEVGVLSAPLTVPGFHLAQADGSWRPTYIGSDAELSFNLDQGTDLGPPVTVYVEYYRSARPGHSLITHLNREWDAKIFHAVGTGKIDARLGKTPITLEETQLSSTDTSRLVWTSYWVAGHFTPNALSVKIWQAIGVLRGKEGEAVLAVSTPIDSEPEVARARLTAALQNLGALSHRLAAASAPANSQAPR